MTMKAFEDALRTTPLFEQLADEELTELVGLVHLRRYKEHMYVCLEGEPADSLFIIVEGRVRMVKSFPDGREYTMEILGPGEVLAGVSFLDAGPYPATGETLEESRLGLLRYQDLADLIRKRPEIALKLMAALADRLRRAQEKAAQLAVKNIHERLAHVLLQLAEDQGKKTEQGTLLDFTLTHQQLASLVGATRETVTRALGDFRRAGAISDYNNGFLLSLDQLRTWIET